MSFFKYAANFLSFGSLDRGKAKEISSLAEKTIQESRELLEKQRQETQRALEELGELKLRVYTETLEHFVEVYQKIGKIDNRPLTNFTALPQLAELGTEPTKVAKVSLKPKEIGVAFSGASILSSMAVSGALSLATWVGTASTGTPIATLTGIAAQNATLAWLGGGALSAGGAGIAGGMVVLTGIALTPFTFMAMFLGTKQAARKLNNVMEFYEKAQMFAEQAKTINLQLVIIRDGAYLFKNTIEKLNNVLIRQMEEFDRIFRRIENRSWIRRNVIDWLRIRIFGRTIYTKKEEKIIVDAVNTAKLLKDLINKPLINEECAFLNEAKEYVLNNSQVIEGLTQKYLTNVDGK